MNLCKRLGWTSPVSQVCFGVLNLKAPTFVSAPSSTKSLRKDLSGWHLQSLQKRNEKLDDLNFWMLLILPGLPKSPPIAGKPNFSASPTECCCQSPTSLVDQVPRIFKLLEYATTGIHMDLKCNFMFGNSKKCINNLLWPRWNSSFGS